MNEFCLSPLRISSEVTIHLREGIGLGKRGMLVLLKILFYRDLWGSVGILLVRASGGKVISVLHHGNILKVLNLSPL